MSVISSGRHAEGATAASPFKRPRYKGWAQEHRQPAPSANLSFNSGVASINISTSDDDDIDEAHGAPEYRQDNMTSVAIPEPSAVPPDASDSTSSETPYKFSYTINWKDLWDAQQAIDGTKGSFWTHEMYRGPHGEPVKIVYCGTRMQSEAAAKSLLKEKVLGFDMEWASRAAKGIKGNISLIQVACEDRVVLFHIALHDGTTAAELLAPSLRKIIESPNITKTGVAILNADGKRLKRYMALKPAGFFELSYLHRVVKYSMTDPSKVSKTLFSLAKHVQEHLGLPLSKGPVRCSNWTRPLSAEQIEYSVADAYAGFMLFHVLNNKRMALKPTPPLPAFAELFQPLELAEPAVKSTSATNRAAGTSEHPASTPPTVQYPNLPPSGPTRTQRRKVSPICNAQLPSPETSHTSASAVVFKAPPSLSLTLEPLEKRLFSVLSALSKRISHLSKLPAQLVCSEDTLVELCRKRPSTYEELKSCRGAVTFSTLVSQHGVDLLAFIKKYSPAGTDRSVRVPLAPLDNDRVARAPRSVGSTKVSAND